MNVVEQLASSLGRRDEVPNQELAQKIAAQKDSEAVKELVTLLDHKSKDVQHDAIKVLYEIGDLMPGLINPYTPVFINLLVSKNNRMQWGGMAALDAVNRKFPLEVFEHLGAIANAMDLGSVITRDRGMSVLLRMYEEPELRKYVFPLFMEQMLRAATNQLPMYAEMALPLVQGADRQILGKVLTDRLDEMDKESKKLRIEKVLKKLKS